jgi:hypothetical protein
MSKKGLEENSDSNIVKRGKLSWAVFLFTLFVVLISMIAFVFPALLISEMGSVNEIEKTGLEGLYKINPYELGYWAVPLFISNIIVFTVFALYYCNKLPDSIRHALESLFSFEISRKTAVVIFLIILAGYVAFSSVELTEDETWEDWDRVKERLEGDLQKGPMNESCDIMMTIEHCYGWPRANPTVSSGFEPHARYFLLKLSVALFDNYKIFPFFASIGLLLVTYLFATLITGKRFAGIISLVIMVQSNLFLSFDTSPTYSNFWTLFYVLSLYLAVRLWMVSPAIYLLSIFAKVLTVAFLPMSIFFILSSDIPKKKKAFVVLTSVIIVAGGVIIFATQNLAETEGAGLNSDEFWAGMSSFANQIRHDGLIVLFILPLVFGLFMVSKRSRYANSIMLMIAGMLVIVPLISGFTEITNQPYRFVPLVFFFAIGVGTLLSKR